MPHSDIISEQLCQGELTEMEQSSTDLQFMKWSSCGTEFAFEPDSDWVTVIYLRMRR